MRLPSFILAAAAVATFSTIATAAITPLTGGDSTDGLNLSGLSVVYAVDNFSGSTNTILQAVNFYAENNLTVAYGAGTVVAVQNDGNWNQNLPVFSSETSDDTAMRTLLNDYNFGQQVWQFNTTAGTSYRLHLLGALASDGAGSSTGYIGDFGFKQGNGTTDWTQYAVIEDNLITPAPSSPPQGIAITYDFVATTTTASFILTYPNRLGVDPGSTPQNAGGAVALGGWALTQSVPEPTSMAILGLGVLGLIRRRR